MLREVTFPDERSKHSLRQQGGVAVCSVLRVYKGPDESFRHERVGDPKAREQDFVETGDIDDTVAVHILQGGDGTAFVAVVAIVVVFDDVGVLGRSRRASTLKGKRCAYIIRIRTNGVSTWSTSTRAFSTHLRSSASSRVVAGNSMIRKTIRGEQSWFATSGPIFHRNPPAWNSHSRRTVGKAGKRTGSASCHASRDRRAHGLSESMLSGLS